MFDAPRTVTIGRDGRRIDRESTLGQVAVDYRFASEPRARGGKMQGSLVNFVVTGCFKARRFLNRRTLLLQLAEWHRASARDGSRSRSPNTDCIIRC